MASSEPNRPIFLFTHPRTASNLLMQMLRAHADIETVENPFVDTYYFGTEALTRRRNDRIDGAKKRMQASPELPLTYQAAFNELERSIQKAQTMGKTPFIKEHAFTVMKPETISKNVSHPPANINTPQVMQHDCNGKKIPTKETGSDNDDHSNPTVLPTGFLQDVTPVFLIRHPALVFESILKVSGPTMGAHVDDEEFPVDASLRWQRVLYDWYANSPKMNDATPIVLEADDVIASPTIVQQLCERIHVNPAGVRFEWDPVAPSIIEGQSSYHRHFFSTIQSSSGVRLDKHSAAGGQGLNLDVKAETWRQEYGAETAATLRSFVEAAMPDYEYLSRSKLHI